MLDRTDKMILVLTWDFQSRIKRSIGIVIQW